MLGRTISIDVLPNDALLEIFDFYVGEDLLTKKGILVDVWRTLVHVCRRWRGLVFRSPLRLKLRLVCFSRTPTRKILDVWPALPLIIRGHTSTFVMDNLIAALEHRDRVCKIDLVYYDSQELRKFWEAMQQPFPKLTHLWLEARRKATFEDAEDWELFATPSAQDVSNSFLGGSAPCLQFVWMNSVRLQRIQTLLLSATHLIDLHLDNIPDYGSARRMATCLSALTSLQTLSLSFQPSIYPPYEESRHPSPSPRIVLPALRYFQFTGTSKYLENLIALIDVPELKKLSVTFTRRVSDTPELAQFVSRMPKLGVPCEARMVFHDFRIAIRVRLSSPTIGHEFLDVGISSGDICDVPMSYELDAQLLNLAQVGASLPIISTVEDLYVYEASTSALSWSEEPENTPWLKLLRPFIGLKNLYLFKEFAPRIASDLEALEDIADEDIDEEDTDEEDVDEGDIGKGSTIDSELLPSLQNIFVQGLRPSGYVAQGIRQFIDARQLIGHTIAVSSWDIKYDETWA